MKHASKRELGRLKRKMRSRAKLSGSSEKPRLSVFKSAKHIYVQLIDDSIGKTLASCSTIDKTLKGKVKGTLEGAEQIGKTLAERAIEKGIKKVVFDRNGFRYHGQLKVLADAARKAGLEF